MRKGKKIILFNIPNILSFLRILLIPVFAVFVFRRKTLEAFAVLLAASLTDLLDGLTARLLHQKTSLGSLLDPVADKLLMTASFILLTIPDLNSPNVIPFWLTSVVVGRDLLIVSAAFILYKLRGQKTFPPSILGKASTVCQITVVLLVLLFNIIKISPPSINWLFFLTLAFTLLSAVHYSMFGFRVIASPKRS